jgi:hypothetical protein
MSREFSACTSEHDRPSYEIVKVVQGVPPEEVVA